MRAAGAAQGLHRRRVPGRTSRARWAPTAILLIVACLDDARDAPTSRRCARALGMAVLVEVHDERRARARAARCRRRWSASTTATCALSRSSLETTLALLPRVPADRAARHRERHPGAAPTCAACARRACTPSWSARRSCAPPDPGAALAEPVRAEGGRPRRGARVAAAGVGGSAAGLDARALRRGARRPSSRRLGDAPIAPDDPLRALRLVAPADVKVVVIGQDPYPTAGHADGLAFSAGQGRPRSLRAVFERARRGRPGSSAARRLALEAWARQGVLLLNPVLTVEVGRTGSHQDCGWQALTRRDRRAASVERVIAAGLPALGHARRAIVLGARR